MRTAGTQCGCRPHAYRPSTAVYSLRVGLPDDRAVLQHHQQQRQL